MSNIVTLHDISIRQDANGRYSLNDLHKAAGGADKHGPRRWLQLQSTQELVNELEIDGIPSISTKQGLGTFACIELVYDYAAWISASFKVEVYRTFHAVKTGSRPGSSAIPATKEFRALYGLARMLGFDKNVAAIRSNQAAEEVTGVNVLRLLGSEHLESEQQSRWHTPTELGREINVTARQFNLMLADAGLQTKECGEWVPTDAADGLCRLLDTGKKHGSGTAVSQLKWSQDVLRRIGREAA